MTQLPENENEIETADSLMEQLKAEAERRGDPRRLATLSRLVQACNDLQSGAAYRQAKAARETFAEIYDPRFLNLRSKLVSHYVDYRRRIEGSGSEWTGPHDVTIRRHPEWMTYLSLRRQESGPSRKKRRSEGSKRLDDMIDRIPDVFERDQIRAAVERGRKWKNDLDIFVEACRKLPEIDIDLLREGKHPKRHVDAPDASSVMRPDDVRVIRELVMRLQDNGYLEDLELVYRSGRVKMSHGLGRDLIMPEEMQLLERLAGLDAMGVAG